MLLLLLVSVVCFSDVVDGLTSLLNAAIGDGQDLGRTANLHVIHLIIIIIIIIIYLL